MDLELKRLIKSGKAKIAVYGLGQVGSGIAAVWLRVGAHVIGVDLSESVVEEANKGFPNSKEPGVKEAFTKAVKQGRFRATTDGIEASRSSQIKFIAVPVMISNGSIDYSSLEDVAYKIAKGLKKGDIVSLNTSVPPGTTESVILTKLMDTHLKPEKDFLLVYNPERIYIGRVIEDIEENYPAIVAGIGNKSLKAGVMLYSMIAKKGVITMSSIRSAEMEKLMEGVYRDVNIALANEMAKLCEKHGIDFWEVREAANSQRFCNIHRAGVGVGGICIPVYPRFILHSAAMVKSECNITEISRALNTSMPHHCVREAISLLDSNKRNVTVLGLAFRGNIADTRLSPSYDAINEFLKAGFNVTVHEPYANNSILPSNVKVTKNLVEALKGADLIFIATDHNEYSKLNEKKILQLTGNDKIKIYDGRGIIDKRKFKTIPVAGIGRVNV